MQQLRYLFAILCCALLIQPAHASTSNDRCPTISEQFNPDIIRLQNGHIELKEFRAKIDLPPDLKFIGTSDARAYAYHEFKWSVCATGSLAGFIVSGKDWRNHPAADLSQGWMIEVHYVPTFVSPSDIISTNYDEIVQQVRESFYDRERADYRLSGTGKNRHVMGWAIPPDYDVDTDTAIWSLNIIEGNRPNYAVQLQAAKLGRSGHFRLYRHGLISQNDANAEMMWRAIKSISFEKEWTLNDHYSETKNVPTTTIGAVIAESVDARRATPLTWSEYIRALMNGILKLGYHYLIEILALGTIAILYMVISYFRRRWSSSVQEDEDWDDEEFEEYLNWLKDRRRQRQIATANSQPMLNGVPVKGR